jgi:hypothetical protein
MQRQFSDLMNEVRVVDDKRQQRAPDIHKRPHTSVVSMSGIMIIDVSTKLGQEYRNENIKSYTAISGQVL